MLLTPQAIRGRVREEEKKDGGKEITRRGGSEVVTEKGRVVCDNGDEMMRVGMEIQEELDGKTQGSALNLKVGIAMIVPKLLAYRVLEPVLTMPEQVHLVCHEAPLADLLADLSVHKLDVVLCDGPINPTFNIRAYNHTLGESGISFFATSDMADALRADFPASLDAIPMLMPSGGSSLRRTLENWFESHRIKPRVVAEFEDRALMKAFGESGAGVFMTPIAVEQDVLDKYGVELVGRTDEIMERFYAISVERRIKHPAVSAITEAARKELFA